MHSVALATDMIINTATKEKRTSKCTQTIDGSSFQVIEMYLIVLNRQKTSNSSKMYISFRENSLCTLSSERLFVFRKKIDFSIIDIRSSFAPHFVVEFSRVPSSFFSSNDDKNIPEKVKNLQKKIGRRRVKDFFLSRDITKRENVFMNIWLGSKFRVYKFLVFSNTLTYCFNPCISEYVDRDF
jgi:hypothetical protein